MTYYERNLPHWHPEGAMLFVTWRLYGSLPIDFVNRIRNSKEAANIRFARAEALLDKPNVGPLWLNEPEVAKQVEATILRGTRELKQYLLWAYVVMPNHVHALITPQQTLRRIMEGLKGVSAYRANRILKRAGKAFWQRESFDHWVRNEVEEAKIRLYIENNPVKAGLCRAPEEWKWSSASKQ